eukprot:122032_1
MSAGKGVWHSELNKNKNKQCRFLQIWIRPNKKSLSVQYGSKSFSLNDRKNKLLHIIDGESELTKNKEMTAPIRLHQDVNVFVPELDYAKNI